MAIIELEGITRSYQVGGDELKVLKGISLHIEEGEFVAVMGPSGSGKSTLMQIMGLLDRPTNGVYRLMGHDVSRLSDDEGAALRSKTIGFIFQMFNLLPRITVRRNAELPLLYNGGKSEREIRQRAETILESVGLGDRMDHRPTELSGGQQQRVAIARALINEPALILADEPTGNLDSRTGEEIMNLLLGLNKERGLTLVIVTHDPTIASRTQRVIRLRDGLIENG